MNLIDGKLVSMRYSKLFPKTIKNAPKDEVAINAKFLIQAGFIDKLMAGSYTLLPLGRLVERKIEQIVREEMNLTGAEEVLMPLLHPKEIWNETGRWDSAKEVMYQFEKNKKEYALSFTHEEIVLDLIRKHVNTYRDFPIKLYHFSTKFRDELRAKSGILRGREFLMKDLYSAHSSEEDLNNYYDEIREVYLKIFKRLGLDAVVAEASGGVFTESHTHEFQVFAESGEDTIYFKKGWKYWKNREIMTEEELNDPEVESKTAIEVGNIFRFGTVYSEKMGVTFNDKDGVKKPAFFGSYGIGITRLIGVMVELFHDDRGIIWPDSAAPYKVHLVNIGNMEYAEKVYETLSSNKIDVLWDDRDTSPGEKFADADLIGIPTRLVVSDKLGDAQIEVKKRRETESKIATFESFLDSLG